jgi:hypothetical protein
VTERRDTARIGPVDDSPLGVGGPDPSRAGIRRFGRLVPLPTARRLALSKIGPAGVIADVVLGLLVVGGSNLSQRLVAWLHGQAPYQLAFQDIELIPEPPKWLKPGRAGLLEQVRGDRDAFKLFSMADLDLDKLMTDFRRNPWIERVDRAIKTFPNRVAVSLTYFEPVAVVRYDRARFAINRSAIVLPIGEIDSEYADSLIDIIAPKPHEAPRPGVEWPEASDPNDKESGSRVALAARIAGDFHDREVKRNGQPADFVPRSIVVQEADGIWVQMEDETFVFWGRYSQSGKSDEPSDAQKWEWLEARGRGGWGLKSPAYLSFDRDGVRLRNRPR